MKEAAKRRNRRTKATDTTLVEAACALERAAAEIDRLQLLCGQLHVLVRLQDGTHADCPTLTTKLWRQLSAVH